MTHIFSRNLSILLIAIISCWAAPAASAFDISTYASSSVLSSGHWVKVSVGQTGIQFIPAATLRQWGFPDPEKVKVYGYGGGAISNNLTRSNFIDDIPPLQVHATSAGVFFYAEGPESITVTGRTRYRTFNPYSTLSYYFLTADGDPQHQPIRIDAEGELNTAATPVTTFLDLVQHEQDLVSISQSGNTFFGEDFRATRSRSFTFVLDDYVDDSPVWSRTSFATNAIASGALSLAVNGTPVTPAQNILATNDNYYATRATMTRTFTPKPDAGGRITLTLNYNTTSTVKAAHLDFIVLNYQRHLRMPRQGQLSFEASATTCKIAGASTSGTHVWDVTDPHSIVEMNLSAADDGAAFTNPYTGTRSYIAWSESMALHKPAYVSTIANQDLHAYDQHPDMVIITVGRLAAEARRIAAIHTAAPDNMTVLVIDQDQIFNEFASGRPDPGAFRRFLKMIYDRGISADHPLQYALFVGRPTFDNRNITGLIPPESQTVMPTWQTDESLYDNTSYTSDDIYAMLADGSGSSMPSSRLCIAVGRIPARNQTQAREFVDKLIAYNTNRYYSQWKNNILLVADNGNNGDFMYGSEDFQANILTTGNGPRMVYNKVYIDAFNIQNSVCAQGRERFRRIIDEGALWWTYVGHGAINTLSSENIFTNADINNMYNKRWPVFFGATCSFARWDGPEVSGSEVMAFNPDGGVIAAICPTRKAGVVTNNKFVAAMGSYAFATDAHGRNLTPGMAVTAAKNTMLNASSGEALNKLRYVFVGDPALRLTLPDNRLVLQHINGEVLDPESQITIKARQRVTFSGAVTDPEGNPLSDFNGNISISLYDAEYSTTSSGKPADNTQGAQVTFEEMGHKLYEGSGTVTNGIFTAIVEMPSDVSDNFRPATLNMYAVASDGRQAAGANRDFYVFGFDDTAAPDDTPPTIDYAYLNHSSFTQGSIVNEEPIFLARVSDDVAINMSMAGIGHQMTIKLDDRRTYNDVPLYFAPSSDGSPSGTIAYPLGEISEGAHSLSFRVWDAAGNSTTHILNFFVQPGAAPEIFDIYPDASPATDHVNFYISHNRPDAAMTVNLEIFDIAGRYIWSSTQTARSDLWLSAPINWNLCDFSGRRVPRGIYLYKATIIIDGNEISAPAKRIAVAAP